MPCFFGAGTPSFALFLLPLGVFESTLSTLLDVLLAALLDVVLASVAPFFFLLEGVSAFFGVDVTVGAGVVAADAAAFGGSAVVIEYSGLESPMRDELRDAGAAEVFENPRELLANLAGSAIARLASRE